MRHIFCVKWSTKLFAECVVAVIFRRVNRQFRWAHSALPLPLLLLIFSDQWLMNLFWYRDRCWLNCVRQSVKADGFGWRLYCTTLCVSVILAVGWYPSVCPSHSCNISMDMAEDIIRLFPNISLYGTKYDHGCYGILIGSMHPPFEPCQFQ